MNKCFLRVVFFITFLLSNFVYANSKIQRVPIVCEECLPIQKDSKKIKFHISDLPKPCPVQLTMMRMDGSKDTHRLYLTKNGLLTDEEGYRMVFELGNYGYGEVLQVAVKPYSRWSRLRNDIEAYVKFAPNPLQDGDEKGHRLIITPIDVEGTYFEINLSGFQPNEVVRFESQSCHEKGSHNVTLDNLGNAIIGYAPAVIRKKEGPFAITISNENTKLSVQHFWGEIALTSPSKYQKLKEKFPE